MIKPTLAEICKEASKERCKITYLSMNGGRSTALLKEAREETEGTFVEPVQGNNGYELVARVNELGGEIENLITLSGGTIVLVARFKKEVYEKRLQEIEDAKEKARIEAEEAERKAKIDALKAQQEQLESEMEALKSLNETDEKTSFNIPEEVMELVLADVANGIEDFLRVIDSDDASDDELFALELLFEKIENAGVNRDEFIKFAREQVKVMSDNVSTSSNEENN